MLPSVGVNLLRLCLRNLWQRGLQGFRSLHDTFSDSTRSSPAYSPTIGNGSLLPCTKASPATVQRFFKGFSNVLRCTRWLDLPRSASSRLDPSCMFLRLEYSCQGQKAPLEAGSPKQFQHVQVTKASCPLHRKVLSLQGERSPIVSLEIQTV